MTELPQAMEWVNDSKWPEKGLERVLTCPVCGEADRMTLYQELRDLIFGSAPGAWTLVSCVGCGSAYLDPRPTEAAIGLAYRRYYTHGRQASQSTDAGWRTQVGQRLINGYLNCRYGYSVAPVSRLGAMFIPLLPRRRHRADRSVRHLEAIPGGGRLLDVGSGSGGFLLRMRGFGWDVYGVEPDREAVSRSRGVGLVVAEATLGEGLFPDDSFDAITLSHVLEHLHNPRAALRCCFHLLRPGGVLWVTTPNLDSIGHRAFGDRWNGLDPPRHLILFRPTSVAALLRQTGFLITLNPPAYTAKSVFRSSHALVEGRDPFDPRVSFPLRLRARAADVRSLLDPRKAEEITFVAKKAASPDGNQ